VLAYSEAVEPSIAINGVNGLLIGAIVEVKYGGIMSWEVIFDGALANAEQIEMMWKGCD